MIGTLTRKTEPHEKCWSRKPLATGPMAAPPPEMPAHTAIAFPRSWGGNTFVRIESVAGMTNAAPKPITARPAMTPPALFMNAEKSEPARNTVRPNCSAPLRP